MDGISYVVIGVIMMFLIMAAKLDEDMKLNSPIDIQEDHHRAK